MKTYLRLLAYLRPYRMRLAAAVGCMVLYAAMSAVSLGFVAPFMKVLFEGGSPARAAAPAGETSAAAPATPPAAAGREARLVGWPAPLRDWASRTLLDARPLVALERLCLFLLIALLLKNVADYVQAFLMVSVEQAAIRDLRTALFAHLQRLSLDFYHGRRTGALVSRVTNDVEYLRASLAAGISNLVKDSLTLLGCLAWVFIASWKLALFSLAILPPVALALVAIGRKMRTRSGHAQERMADLTSILQETISGARVVKAFGMEPFEQRRFDEANGRFYRAFVRLRRVSAAARPVSEYAIVMVAVAMLWFGGRQIFESHSLEPQQFVLFVTALLSTISPLKSLSEVNANVQQGVAAGQRLFGLLDTPPTVVDAPGAREIRGFERRIRYEGVSFAYGTGDPVLRDLSFEIARGEVVALVGSSGAGKSTTMDLLARFYDPTAGRITIDGADLREVSVASLRAQLGIVTQETILFHDTVRNNIAYGLGGAGEEAVQAAARAAHAHEFITRLPQGYDTVIGDRGMKLSGGERQRLAIARALLKNPPLLLLDEATSSLDAESELLVREALERLMRDRTVLVIAHRLSTVQHAHRIVVLESGRVVASGAHAELMDQDGVYRRLYNLQFVA
ncbi:MAG TPA: ABC transporter ATP-binding protein [Candidatus Eisenbacteria bacterium]